MTVLHQNDLFPQSAGGPTFPCVRSSMPRLTLPWVYSVCYRTSQDTSFEIHTVLQGYFIMKGSVQCCPCFQFLSVLPMFMCSLAPEAHGPDSIQKPGQVLAKEWVGIFSLRIHSFPTLSLFPSPPHWYLEHRKDRIQSTEKPHKKKIGFLA